jgi:hypothetical protein
LLDELLRSISQLTIEFHDYQGITTLDVIERITKRLENLGFFSIRMWRHGYGDTLFVNRQLASVSYLECVLVKYVIRNQWGLKRVFSRMFRSTRSLGLAKRTTFAEESRPTAVNCKTVN